MDEDGLRDFLFYEHDEELPEELREVLDRSSMVRKISAEGSSLEGVGDKTRENYISRVEKIAQENGADVVKELSYQKIENSSSETYKTIGIGVIRIYEITREP